VVGAAHEAAAQPSTSQIKRRLTKRGVKRIKFTKRTGTKQWNSRVKTWEYVRGVHVIREYKPIRGVDLVVVGDVVYQRFGRRWRYWKFRVAQNRYLGIPNPRQTEIMAVLKKDMRKFVSSYNYNKIVGELKNVGLSPKPRWKWHRPTRVSFHMVATFDIITSNTNVESREQEFEVSFYRDDYKAPWKSFMSTSRARKKLGTRKYTSQKIRAMKTLGSIDSQRRSKAAAAKLPAVNVPQFKNAAQLALFTHKMLRHSTPLKLEAYFMKVLAPHYFNNKSAGQLNQRGARLINLAAKRAFKLKATYKLMYCENPGVDRRRSSKTRYYLRSVIRGGNTMIAGRLMGGRYKEGVKVGQQWMITDLHVGVPQRDNAIQLVNSFSSRKKICPNDKI